MSTNWLQDSPINEEPIGLKEVRSNKSDALYHLSILCRISHKWGNCWYDRENLIKFHVHGRPIFYSYFVEWGIVSYFMKINIYCADTILKKFIYISMCGRLALQSDQAIELMCGKHAFHAFIARLFPSIDLPRETTAPRYPKKNRRPCLFDCLRINLKCITLQRHGGG